MNGPDFERIAAAFNDARESPPHLRPALLQRAFPDDPTLREHVERMLAADDRPGLLDDPLVNLPLDPDAWTDSAPHPARPERIAQYRILEPIAEGEHTSVYLAEQERPFRRTVAVKVLHGRSARRDVLRRFEQERRTLALMQHPNIAAVYDAGETGDGLAYFAMEHVPGLPLTRFADDLRLSTRQRLDLFIQVCRAVEHAHQRGVIHRDLKPSNILALRDQSGAHIVKIIDFGIAHALRGPGAHAPPVLGTLPYMAPEQLGDQRTLIDTRADVYALGAVLFELLSGRPAFDLAGQTPRSAIALLAHAAPPRLGALRRDLRGDLEHIAAKALARNPDDRYANVTDLRADLERFLQHRPVTARHPSPLYLARKFAARHRTPLALAVFTLATLAVLHVQSVRAERDRFRAACDLARAWFKETIEISRTAGQHGLRSPSLRHLEAESAKYLAALPNDPETIALRAEIVQQLADAYLEDGNLPEARRLFQECYELQQRLAAGGRTPDLSIAIVRLGDVARAAGERETMLAHYQRALEIDQALVIDNPNSRRAVSNLLWSYDRLGVIAAEEDDLDSALALHRAQLRMAHRLRELDDGPEAWRAIAVTRGHLAHHARLRGDPLTAADHLNIALLAIEHARTLAPHDRLILRAHLGHRLTLADLNRELTGNPPSLQDARLAADEAAALHRADPADRDAAYMFAQTQYFLAFTAKAHQAWDTAAAAAATALAAAERILQSNPLDPSAARLVQSMRKTVDDVRAAREAAQPPASPRSPR